MALSRTTIREILGGDADAALVQSKTRRKLGVPAKTG